MIKCWLKISLCTALFLLSGCHLGSEEEAESQPLVYHDEPLKIEDKTEEAYIDSFYNAEHKVLMIIKDGYRDNYVSAVGDQYIIEQLYDYSAEGYKRRFEGIKEDINKSNWRYYTSELRKFEAKLRDVRTGEEVKVVDVKAILERDVSEEYYYLSCEYTPMEYQGKPCLRVRMFTPVSEQVPYEDGQSFYYAMLDLDNEKVIDFIALEEWHMPRIVNTEWYILYFTELAERLEAKMTARSNWFIRPVRHNQDYTILSMSSLVLPDENEQLYGMFPELKTVLAEKGGEEFGVELHFNQNLGANDILSYVVEDGTEIMEDGKWPRGGVWISGLASKSGEATLVSSSEEFLEEFSLEKYLELDEENGDFYYRRGVTLKDIWY